MCLARVYRVGFWFGFIRSALLLAVVACNVLSIEAMPCLYCFLCATQPRMHAVGEESQQWVRACGSACLGGRSSCRRRIACNCGWPWGLWGGVDSLDEPQDRWGRRRYRPGKRVGGAGRGKEGCLQGSGGCGLQGERAPPVVRSVAWQSTECCRSGQGATRRRVIRTTGGGVCRARQGSDLRVR